MNKQPLGIKSITQANAIGLAEDYSNRIFSLDWVFCEWYEKIILVASFSFSVYSLFKYIWGLF